MSRLIDKVIVFTLCVVPYFQDNCEIYSIVPVICMLTVGGLMSYLENDIFNLAVFIVYCVISAIYPNFLFFLPLICYDFFTSKWKYALFLAVIPLGQGFTGLSVFERGFIIPSVALSYLLHLRTGSLERIKSEYIALRDTTKEFSLQLESKNKELMEKQDYEIKLATLNERNRIARDIHDSIGHILTNCILQTGALMATCQDSSLYDRLNTLKNMLLVGMDNVRESIHDLYDESVDLYVEAKALVDNFQFCETSFDYEMESNPDKKIKYAFLAVLKEALSNIIKHTDATDVKITMREHPALYQLIIKDNGSKKAIGSDGIGLKNIEQRVNSLRGFLNISRENGFTVFISIPKEHVQ